MTDWFTSDDHFWHARILEHCPRPWTTIEEMNEGLIQNWNNVVSPADTVWNLGDVGLGDRHLDPVARLNGHIILVAGNHDTCWSGHHRKAKAKRAVQTYLDAGFAEVYDAGQVMHIIGGKPVMLSHLPYAGDHTEPDRYANRRPIDYGLPMLCGHVHNAWRTRGRMINVGVDVNDYTPIHEDQLAAELAQLGDPR